MAYFCSRLSHLERPPSHVVNINIFPNGNRSVTPELTAYLLGLSICSLQVSWLQEGRVRYRPTYHCFVFVFLIPTPQSNRVTLSSLGGWMDEEQTKYRNLIQMEHSSYQGNMIDPGTHKHICKMLFKSCIKTTIMEVRFLFYLQYLMSFQINKTCYFYN